MMGILRIIIMEDYYSYLTPDIGIKCIYCKFFLSEYEKHAYQEGYSEGECIRCILSWRYLFTLPKGDSKINKILE